MPRRTLQKMAGLEQHPFVGFPPRSIDDCRRLRRPVRELLLAIYGLVGLSPYAEGQTALAKALKRGIRTVQRNVATLIEEGYLIEQRRQRGLNALLFVHPVVQVFVADEHVRPSRPRYARKAPPALTGLPVMANGTAARCATVRRRNGSRFLPVAYVADLLTATEQHACIAAVARAGDRARLCHDDELNTDLAQYFLRVLRRAQIRAQTLAWIATLPPDPWERYERGLDDAA